MHKSCKKQIQNKQNALSATEKALKKLIRIAL